MPRPRLFKLVAHGWKEQTMKQWWWLLAGLAISGLLVAFVLRGTSESVVRTTLQEAVRVTEVGLNRGDLNDVEPFFATTSEGANLAGLGQTLGLLRMVANHLNTGDQVQIHRFEVPSVAVHESDGLARATYRLQFSIVRGGTAIYSADVTQNVALLKTAQGWRISGGDQPQLSDILGTWPPR